MSEVTITLPSYDPATWGTTVAERAQRRASTLTVVLEAIFHHTSGGGISAQQGTWGVDWEFSYQGGEDGDWQVTVRDEGINGISLVVVCRCLQLHAQHSAPAFIRIQWDRDVPEAFYRIQKMSRAARELREATGEDR